MGSCCVSGFCGFACALRWAVGSSGCVGAVARVRRFRPEKFCLTWTYTYPPFLTARAKTFHFCGARAKTEQQTCAGTEAEPVVEREAASLRRACVAPALGSHGARWPWRCPSSKLVSAPPCPPAISSTGGKPYLTILYHDDGLRTRQQCSAPGLLASASRAACLFSIAMPSATECASDSASFLCAWCAEDLAAWNMVSGDEAKHDMLYVVEVYAKWCGSSKACISTYAPCPRSRVAAPRGSASSYLRP